MSYRHDWYGAYDKLQGEWEAGCDTMRRHQSGFFREGGEYRMGAEQTNEYFYSHAIRMCEEAKRRSGGRR